MPYLTLRLLGELEACTASGAVPVVFCTKKSQALLAYLAVIPGRRHSREKLASLLWDVSDSRARVNLRQTLTRLRKSLCHSRHACVLGDSDTIWIDPASIDTDVLEFDMRCNERTPRALQRAAELYSGEFLENFALNESAFDEWLQLERTRLHERAVDAMSMLLEQCLENLDVKGGISIGCRLLGIDPLQEHVHRALMRLYLAQGRRQSSLKQYQYCRELLERELGISPDAETQALHREILASASTMVSLPERALVARRLSDAPFQSTGGTPDAKVITHAVGGDIDLRKRDSPCIHVAFSCEISIDVKRITQRVRDVGSTACGLVLGAMPLAIWATPTETAFLTVLASGALVLLLSCAFAIGGDSTDDDRARRLAFASRQRLDDEFMAALSNNGPWPWPSHRRQAVAAEVQRRVDLLLGEVSKGQQASDVRPLLLKAS